MKKSFSRFSVLALTFHVLLFAGALISLLMGRVGISSDFLSLLPGIGLSEGFQKADRKFASSQNSSVNILFESKDFQVAKGAALEFREKFNGSGVFDDMSLTSDGFDASSFAPLLAKYRYQLMPKEERDMILSNPSAYQESALALIYSPFTFSSLESLDEDPFLIDDSIIRGIANKASSLTSVSPKEGVLAAEKDGVSYVLLSGHLSNEAQDITGSAGIKDMYGFGDSLEEKNPGLKISYSGFPLHAYESSMNAQREVALITGVSIALILVMYLLTFRNIYVIFLFLVSISLSLISAFSALFIFFPKVHVLTCVFGTSLIGTGIDYATHYYCAFSKREEGETPDDTANGLFKNLSVSMASTVLCYGLIFFSPYGILKQIALFSVFGLISSYLVALGIFPLIVKDFMVSDKFKNRKELKLKGAPKRTLFVLLFFSLALLAFNIPRLKVENKISNLYTMSDRLLESEKTMAIALGYSKASYAIVEGCDEHDARERESLFSEKLDGLKDSGILSSIFSLSSFIPSPSEQERNLKAADALAPLVQSQADALGTDANVALNAIEQNREILDLGDLPEGVRGMLSALDIGEIDGRYYIAVLMFGVSDEGAVKEAANAVGGVVYFQKATDINRQLDELTSIILRLFFIAVLLIILLIVIFFRKKALRMVSAPLIILSLTLSSVPMMGRGMDFFFSVGLLVVIGLGLDYMVFALGGKKRPTLAISLSFMTTALSFGTLAFSSFAPVSIFGSTVLIGISAAYLCALL